MENLRSKIFVIAGEKSGDINSSKLLKKLLAINNNVMLKGIGGSYLKNSTGMDILYDYSSVNYVGFSSVFGNYFKLKRIFNKTTECFFDYNPSVLFLVDFPGFNLRFAENVRKEFKGKIIYYISPQLWAWHKSRINIIRKCIDEMLVVIPFEVEFYKKENFNVHYAGNPLLESVDNFLKTARKKSSEKPLISVMPGSRQEEFDRIFPELVNPLQRLRKDLDADITLIHSENVKLNRYKNILDRLEINISVPCSDEEKYGIILNSNLVITKFGTSSTECAFIGTPFISVYKTNPLNYFIAAKLVSLQYATLANIIAGKEIVREYIQNDFTTENIIQEAKKIITDNNYRNEILSDLLYVKNVFYKTKITIPPEELLNKYLINS